MAELLFLSDDTLLAVLAYLPIRELFSLRTVCRRLRDLCVKRDLWRHARVEGKGLVRAALALAPCLGLLDVAVEPLGDIASFVRSTTCVVSRLNINVASQDDADLATHIIQKLSAVGGVKTLHLEIFSGFAVDHTLMPLLQAVFNTHGLQELMFRNHSSKVLCAALRGLEGGPSLLRLFYSSSSAEPFLESILQTHADSLEEIGLNLQGSLPVSSLARIPRLRTLSCSPHDDLPQLLHLNLKELYIFPTVSINSGTLDLLRHAAHLRNVRFCLPVESPDAPLLALGASPSAHFVKQLGLLRVCVGNLNRVAIVAAALPKFPALKTLCMDAVPSYDFLRAVSPASAPCLIKLSVYRPPLMCPHAWLHDPAVQDLLVRNPALHLKLVASSGSPSISGSCECQWCLWGCHGPLRGLAELNLLFSSHRKKAQCPSKCFQVVVSPTCTSCRVNM